MGRFMSGQRTFYFWRSVWLGVAALYLALWGLTWFAGIPQVDQDFDRLFAVGSISRSGPSVPVRRLPFFDASDHMTTPPGIAGSPWRCRSHGFAVAPFVIIDRAACRIHPMAGFSGVRLVVWFFGESRWTFISKDWDS